MRMLYLNRRRRRWSEQISHELHTGVSAELPIVNGSLDYAKLQFCLRLGQYTILADGPGW